MSLDVKSSTSNKTCKIGLGEKTSYGFGNLAGNLLLTTANTFISFFYTDVAGIAVTTVGFILLAGRLLDGVADLSMGVIVDKTKTKYGKARPWLLWLAIPYAVSLILMFTAPNLSVNGKIVYAFVTYVFAMLMFTGTATPYNVLSALISQEPNDRSQLSSFRSMFGFLGALIISIITMPLVKFFGDGKKGWVILAIVYGVVSAVLYFVCFKNTKERIVASVEQSSFSVKEGLKTLFKNKYWAILVVSIIITFISAGLGGINVYYAKYILGDPNLVGVIGTASFLPIIVGSFLAAPILTKFGKRNTALGGVILTIVGSLVMAVAPINITIIIVGLVIKGLGLAGFLVSAFAMLGDTVEYGQWKSGIRIEGLTFAAEGFAEKVGTGLGGAVLGLVLGFGGYVGGKAIQSTSAIFAMKVSFAYAPIIISLITAILLYFYDLDKIYPQIVAELKERNHKA
ncbi:MFS transporter [Clostridium estertheticum]|uniref:MFS transporter n=1 Tax=Clostridium estertheticum TaxID=238834 RepID=UPI001CF23C24|nr:MFS transporter [Clostridium estertheticum]MCB2305579.1 MFS transporter [Clostridium estertheticum]MCB2344018.1 MFS transporter [Clostridium estertheticum]MCB2348934.1 MFS transporter [Clostridium estertheticum]WAG46249.1 MFS transporter [Clostridium estertheticum]